MKTISTPTSFCYNCGEKLTQASSHEGYEPEEGDLSICVGCGTLLVFDENLLLVQPAIGYLESLSPEQKEMIDVYQKTLVEAKALRKARSPFH